MRKFIVYLEDGDACYKLAIPANNEKDAIEYVQGNGEVVAIKDVTNEYVIQTDKVKDALFRSMKFNKMEMDFIIRCLEDNNIIE